MERIRGIEINTSISHNLAAPPECRKCGTDLNIENWYSSQQKRNQHICKGCQKEQARAWYKANPEKTKAKVVAWQKANPEKAKANWTRGNRKQGHRSFDENKECSMFLGIHVAERVLRHAFQDVKQMPINNRGFDFICIKDRKVDVKSSCQGKNGAWSFHINRNTIADFFLCLAFDTRENLNPMHAWLLPGIKFNRLTGTGISPSTIDRWDEYKQDIAKVAMCCDTMKGVEL